MSSTSRAFLVALIVLFAPPAFADWSDLLDQKQSDATDKVQNRAGQEVDKKVDQTVDCLFNPVDCAQKAKPKKKEEPAGSDAAGEPPRPPSATRPKAGPPPPPSARTWYIDIGGGHTREVSETELIDMISRGEVATTTPVWTEAFGGEYKPAGTVSVLERHFPVN